MKSVLTVLLSVLLFLPINSYAQNIPPHISELSGMEDYLGNTKLFYRIYSSTSNQTWQSAVNHIRILDPISGVDSIFLNDSWSCNPWIGYGSSVKTYDIWNKDPGTYIYAGDYVNCFEPYYFISRFDSLDLFGDMFLFTQKIVISKQNDSLVFALPMLVSYNGGFNWDTLNINHELSSVSPFNDAVYFSYGYQGSNNRTLYKSTDSGNTFTAVDTSANEWSAEFYYDSNENHIYRKYGAAYPEFKLKVSSQQGSAFTWQTIYSTNNNFYVSLDESQSGTIYLADGNRILKSTNYGSTFSLYKQLERDFVGIYKKPNSDKIYAATKYKMYEFDGDSTRVLKALSVPQSILSYYPLQVGNRWVYDYTFCVTPVNCSDGLFIRTVINIETKPNGKTYFAIEEKYLNWGITETVYERIDTTEGKIYRYSESCPGQEQFIDDLLIEIGDTTFASRFGWCIEHPPTEFSTDEPFNQWGLQGRKRNYIAYDLFTAEYSLVSGIGYFSNIHSDDNGVRFFDLKGCIVDGVLYGDTLTTSIEEEPKLPSSFSLSQNYPNPFNPSTKIRFVIPNEVRNLKDFSSQTPRNDNSLVTLKVYDILGNEVASLVNEHKPAGNYEVEFNVARSADGGSSPAITSGVYFYQLKVYTPGRAGEFVETKKMILIK